MTDLPKPARLLKALLIGTAVPTMALAAPALASATWSSAGSGQATAAAYTMPAGTQPTGGWTRGLVFLRWPSVALGGGQAIQGYEISRSNAATGATGPAGGTCSGVVTTANCADSTAAAGSWTYTITPVQLSWSGAAGPASAPVVVP